MKRLAIAATLLLATASFAETREEGALRLDGIPEIPSRVLEGTARYQNVRSSRYLDWAPSGGLLITTRFGQTNQLHHVGAPGGARRQLTFFKEPVRSASFGPEPGWLLFNRDSGGNEASQIFRFDLETGAATLLTDGERQNGEPVWSNARDRVAWRSTARNGRDHDIWVMEPEKPEERRIVHRVEGYWFPIDWSPDDKRLLVARYVSANESYAHVLDLATGDLSPVGPHPPSAGETVSTFAAAFDRGGERVFLVSDAGSEHRTLRLVGPGDEVRVLSSDLPGSVGAVAISRDRRRLAFAVNQEGRDRLFLLDASELSRQEVEIPLGVLGGFGFSRDGTVLALTLTTPSSPADAYTLESSGALTRWTESEVGGLDTERFRTAELVHYPTFDRVGDEPRRIPAWLYRPAGDGPFPVIVSIHGGPEGQARPWFSPTTQYAVNELGCAVLQPNVRGSAGYGKSYLKLDNGRLREDSVRDVGALLDWIRGREDLDEARVGVIGGSYGGYMTLATLLHYGDRVRAGIDVVGISNFVTFLENTSDYRRDLRRVEYGDERDPEMRAFLQQISPASQPDRIRVPLFVAQGANDPRVPASESEQIVRRVREAGTPVWYLLARNEGHGFRKKRNREQLAAVTALFWETFLLPR